MLSNMQAGEALRSAAFFGGVAQLVSVWAYSRATGGVAQFGGFKGTVWGSTIQRDVGR